MKQKIYKVGRSIIRGNHFTTISDLKEVTKDEFYSLIDVQLKTNKLQKHRKEALKIGNLRKVVKIGDLCFKID
jgi:hypothetical protein